MKKPELLAPAGDLERLKWALSYGADAVYVGGTLYSLRANANNFTIEDLKEACEFAHNLNKKVYVTVNMLFHEKDLKNVDNYLQELNNIGIDAFIVSDMAIIKKIKELDINIPIILSTQMSATNYEALEHYKKLGIKRVVLARECSKEDIKEMKSISDMELEVFIHGAMCTSYSGRCVMSNYVTLRDSNRGGCSQICRFIFDIENEDKEFQMCSKDLNMVDYLSDLIDLGVESFKIEGRMKSLYYIATVTDAYRHMIDKKLCNKLTENEIKYYKLVLNRVANRENTPQFFDKEPGVNEQYYSGREEVSNQDFLAIVKDYNDGVATIEQRNNFKVGDVVEVFGPNTEVFKATVESLTNTKGINVESAKHPQEILYLPLKSKVNKGDIIRVKMLDF